MRPDCYRIGSIPGLNTGIAVFSEQMPRQLVAQLALQRPELEHLRELHRAFNDFCGIHCNGVPGTTSTTATITTTSMAITITTTTSTTTTTTTITTATTTWVVV